MMSSIEKIKLKIREAEKRKRKIAMFHFQSLINVDEFKGVDAVQFCRDVGMKDSFATEFRKMIKLSQILTEEGYTLQKDWNDTN